MIKIIVDKAQRQAKMRAHSATHLLHAQLATIFPMTKQAGSLVKEDYTRFDFVADRALSQDEIQSIENNINALIRDSLAIHTQELSYDDAIKSGAKAFFQDKYDDTVRVVSIGDSQESVSIELCGGTHVHNTSAIGACKIVGQEAVAAGTKRVILVTGPAVTTYAQQQDKILNQFALELDVPRGQLAKKIEKMLKENKTDKQTIVSLQTKLLNTELEKIATQSTAPRQYVVDIPESLLPIGFKIIVEEAKTIFTQANIIVRSAQGQFALIGGGTDLDVKSRAQQHGLRGGGSTHVFQGKDSKIFDF